MKAIITDRSGNTCECFGLPFNIVGLFSPGGVCIDEVNCRSLEYLHWWVWFMDFELTLDGERFNKEIYDAERKRRIAESDYISDMGIDISDADEGL